MPLDIRAFTIWQRIIEKFDLEEGGLEEPKPQLATVVQPIFDIDHATRSFTRGAPTLNLDVTAGDYVEGLLVPANTRWELEVINADATTANSAVVIRVSSVNIPIVLPGTAEVVILNPGITLQEGDSIGMLATDNVGDNARVLRVRYSAELIRVVAALP